MVHMYFVIFCIHAWRCIDIFSILPQASHYLKENEKFKKECARLRGELDKENKDAQGKSDVYKKKTMQFQVPVQWKEREETEAKIHVSVCK